MQRSRRASSLLPRQAAMMVEKNLLHVFGSKLTIDSQYVVDMIVCTRNVVRKYESVKFVGMASKASFHAIS
jgi:hypothetical protein